MDNNDILRQVRYALNINDSAMIEIFRLDDHKIEQSKLTSLLKKEDQEGFVHCGNALLGSFLDGLIIYKRGRRETSPGEIKKTDPRLTNNAILKKLRIAVELKEEDILAALRLAAVDISKPALTALFRKEGHKNYKECGDQFLRKFLKGLSLRYRS
jgi:uncharacterized protein YehS (DUF1456 family)